MILHRQFGEFFFQFLADQLCIFVILAILRDYVIFEFIDFVDCPYSLYVLLLSLLIVFYLYLFVRISLDFLSVLLQHFYYFLIFFIRKNWKLIFIIFMLTFIFFIHFWFKIFYCFIEIHLAGISAEFRLIYFFWKYIILIVLIWF